MQTLDFAPPIWKQPAGTPAPKNQALTKKDGTLKTASILFHFCSIPFKAAPTLSSSAESAERFHQCGSLQSCRCAQPPAPPGTGSYNPCSTAYYCPPAGSPTPQVPAWGWASARQRNPPPFPLPCSRSAADKTPPPRSKAYAPAFSNRPRRNFAERSISRS